MSRRTKARRRALELLFEADQRGVSAVAIGEARADDATYPMQPYTLDLLRGHAAHAAEIDEAIGAYSSADWPLERMPAVDRNLLRLAFWEVQHNPEVPNKVVVAEARDLARELSTDDSPKFISGVLGRLLDDVGV